MDVKVEAIKSSQVYLYMAYKPNKINQRYLESKIKLKTLQQWVPIGMPYFNTWHSEILH